MTNLGSIAWGRRIPRDHLRDFLIVRRGEFQEGVCMIIDCGAMRISGGRLIYDFIFVTIIVNDVISSVIH